MGSASNKMNWTNPWSKESNTIVEDIFKKKIIVINGKAKNDFGIFEE